MLAQIEVTRAGSSLVSLCRHQNPGKDGGSKKGNLILRFGRRAEPNVHRKLVEKMWKAQESRQAVTFALRYAQTVAGLAREIIERWFHEHHQA
jgi:hypothetical protein